MPRVIKKIKLQNNEEVEVYSDSCVKCQKEMIYPRDEADKVEILFPFVKDKIEKGTPCMECISKEPNGPASLFSEDEIDLIKNVVISRNLR